MSKNTLNIADGDLERGHWLMETTVKYVPEGTYISPESRVHINLSDIFDPNTYDLTKLDKDLQRIYSHCDAWWVSEEYSEWNKPMNNGRKMVNIADAKAGIHKDEYFSQIAGYALAKMIELDIDVAMVRLLYYDQTYEKYLKMTKAEAMVEAQNALLNRLRPNPFPRINSYCQYCSKLINGECSEVTDKIRELVNLERVGFSYSESNADEVYYLAGIAEKAKKRAADIIKANSDKGITGNFKVSDVKGRKSIKKTEFFKWIKSIGMTLRDALPALSIDNKKAEEAVTAFAININAGRTPDAHIPTKIPEEIYEYGESTQKINPNTRYNPLKSDE